jgi:hypothetical protein
MEQGGVRLTVFLLLGVAGVTGLSALLAPTDPKSASAVDAAFDDASEPSLEEDSELTRDHAPLDVAAAKPSTRKLPFLDISHALVIPPPAPEMREWTWDDDSTQILFDGCKPIARDPLVPKARLSVKAPVDFGALAAVEDHFGFQPDDIFALQASIGEEVEYTLPSRLGDDVVAALTLHGIEVTDTLIRPDYAWIVAQTAAHLRSLAEAIVAEWRASMPAPAAGDTAKPGNIVRLKDTVEALTSFVQRAVPYESIATTPGARERCGVRTPGPALNQGADCDSKALLLAALIRSIDATTPIVLISLQVGGRPHMIIGVGIEGRPCDAILDYRGRRYVLIEVTSALGVGIMAPDYNEAVLERYTVID